MNIQSIGSANSYLNQLEKIHSGAGMKPQEVDFGRILNKAISEISDLQRVSSEYDEMLIAGKIDNLHEPLIAAKKAEIMFSFGLEVRAQILDAYRELMRIQL